MDQHVLSAGLGQGTEGLLPIALSAPSFLLHSQSRHAGQ